MLFLFDTLTHQKTPFKEQKKGEIKLYVCGITPYDFAHIGHGRCYVFFDFVYRFFYVLGYQVTYCRNFTDIDDKLLNKSVKLYENKKNSKNKKKKLRDCQKITYVFNFLLGLIV
jgi:cysteinyl-tRNA synthetase